MTTKPRLLLVEDTPSILRLYHEVLKALDVELIDAETGERRQATLTPRLLERYAQAYRAHQERVASACVQKQVGLFALDVRTPVADAMLHMLRRGGLVA